MGGMLPESLGRGKHVQIRLLIKHLSLRIPMLHRDEAIPPHKAGAIWAADLPVCPFMDLYRPAINLVRTAHPTNLMDCILPQFCYIH
jgi:hypothetical protein